MNRYQPEIATSAAPPRNDNGRVPVAVGQAVRFVMFEGMKGEGAVDLRQEVEGVVEMVNPKHRTFTVRYGDPPMRTGFQFVDIGTEVRLCAMKQKK